MAGDSFKKRVIEIQFTLAKGQFADKTNSLKVRGLSCDVSIEKAGFPSLGKAQVNVSGLSLDHINTLTTRPMRPFSFSRNKIRVYAGSEDDASLPLVYAGDITYASANFNTGANVPMSFEANTGFFAKTTAAGPIAIKGSAKVTNIIKGISSENGFSFSAENVDTEVKNIVVNGDPIQKILSLTEMTGNTTYLDDDAVIMTRKGRPRKGSVILLSRDTGMVGYPRLDRNSVGVTCLFNPGIKIGSRVKVESIVKPACGEWIVTKLVHKIGAYGDGNKPWFTEVVLKKSLLGLAGYGS